MLMTVLLILAGIAIGLFFGALAVFYWLSQVFAR